MTELQLTILVTSAGSFRIDKDGDLEIEIVSDERSSCHGCCIYLERGEAAQLRNWLTQVLK